MVKNKKEYFLHQSLSTYNVWFLFGPLIPPHGKINATASCGLLASCAFLPSGLFLMPLLPQMPLGSHIVAFALGFVCASVCLGSLVPSLYLAAQCLPRTVRIRRTAVAVSRQCVCWSLSCAWLSFNTPSLMSWTTLCHLLSLLLLLIFSREGMFSLEDLTRWERKLGLWGCPRKETFLQEWRGKPSG